MDKAFAIVWQSPEGVRCELVISHTVNPAYAVAEAWAAYFTHKTGIPHTVEEVENIPD